MGASILFGSDLFLRALFCCSIFFHFVPTCSFQFELAVTTAAGPGRFVSPACEWFRLHRQSFARVPFSKPPGVSARVFDSWLGHVRLLAAFAILTTFHVFTSWSDGVDLLCLPLYTEQHSSQDPR